MLVLLWPTRIPYNLRGQKKHQRHPLTKQEDGTEKDYRRHQYLKPSPGFDPTREEDEYRLRWGRY